MSPKKIVKNDKYIRILCQKLRFIFILSGCGLEKMELERLQIVDAIKGYKSKSVREHPTFFSLIFQPAIGVV